ncbi:hypothetical protein CYY_003060 [Polysphondylium violaceum]|uniref:Proteasome assembly chaperone 1 n=1 Tax=Polysphondylium violaceum TaxID=133409 RepID=A0A8J4PZ27_9MYCE|nr:hypothetical protein CYY_003060 [Polysphondylium violaceum]
MFGFEIQPASSRNWEIEEEEEELTEFEPLPSPVIKFNLSINENDLVQKNLVISTKDIGSLFIQSTFNVGQPNYQIEEIGEITIQDIVPLKPNSKTSILNNNKCIIYRHKEDSSYIFVVCQYDVPADRAVQFSELVLEHIKNPKQVIILDKLLNSHFISQNYEYPLPPFVRALYTSSFKNSYSLVPLESPNIIQNVTASFLTLCEIRNISACSILSFYESYVNIESIQSYESIFKSIFPELKITHTNIKDHYQTVLNQINYRDDKGIYC